MATKAHCAYCFESLNANFSKKRPLDLDTVQELWAKYEADDSSMPDISNATAFRSPAFSRLLSPSTASSSSAPSASSSTPSLDTTASSSTSISTKESSQNSVATKDSLRMADRVGLASAEFPLFVTWNLTSRSGQKSLRGCIGTFEAQELTDGLRSYALTSAFEDGRFDPIHRRELPFLECGVTLLTDFEPISDPMDWRIGDHGLRISFTSHGRRYGATYLPDVAREQGWTKDETIISLMRKAGWSGHKSEWRRVADLKVVRYQGKKCALGYDEWKAWKDWVEENR